MTFITAIDAVRHGVYALAGRSYHHPSWPFLFVYESLKLASLWDTIARDDVN